MVSVKFGVKIQFSGHQKAQQDGMVFMAEKNDRCRIKKTVSIWRDSEAKIFSPCLAVTSVGINAVPRTSRGRFSSVFLPALVASRNAACFLANILFASSISLFKRWFLKLLNSLALANIMS